jgi:hypothetical protein
LRAGGSSGQGGPSGLSAVAANTQANHALGGKEKAELRPFS